jgi:hypothetical protein
VCCVRSHLGSRHGRNWTWTQNQEICSTCSHGFVDSDPRTVTIDHICPYIHHFVPWCVECSCRVHDHVCCKYQTIIYTQNLIVDHLQEVSFGYVCLGVFGACPPACKPLPAPILTDVEPYVRLVPETSSRPNTQTDSCVNLLFSRDYKCENESIRIGRNGGGNGGQKGAKFTYG